MRRALLASLASLLAACGAPTPDELENPAGYELPDEGKTDTVNPTGTDRLGKLTIVSPPATGGLAPLYPSAYLVDRTIGYAQPKNQRVLEGTRTVGLYLHNGPAYDLTTVKITKGATTEVRLAGLHLDHFLMYATTIGVSPQWMTSPPGLLMDIGYAGIPGKFWQLFAQSFSLTLQADKQLARFDLTTKAGEVTTADLAIPDPRMRMNVATPARQFPDARAARFLKAMPVPASKLLAIYGSGVIVRSDSVKLLDGQEHLALGNDKSDQHYNLYLNGTFTEVIGKANSVVEIPVRRLDVADVEVADEDGNTVTVHGTYSVKWFAPTASGGMWIAAEEAQNLPTNTGVDVVPGKYEVTVTYPRHEEPTPGVSVYALEIK